jgi:type IV pilus assembly protein PilB
MVQIAKLIRKKMGEVLVDEGLLKDEQVQEATRRQRATGESFGEILVSMAFVTEMDIARTLVKQSGLPYIDASHYRINKDGIQAVPAELLWQNQIIVLDKIGKILLVAISTVISPEILEKLERVSGSQIFVYVSTWSQIQSALEKNVPLAGAAKPAPAKPAAAPVKPGAVPAPPSASGSATAIRAVSPPSGTMPAVGPLRPGTQIRK